MQAKVYLALWRQKAPRPQRLPLMRQCDRLLFGHLQHRQFLPHR
jgi:hypothetical protein